MTIPTLATALDGDKLLKTVGVAPRDATNADLMQAVALLARQKLSERWVTTQAAEEAGKARRVYYLSMEFLIGRSLSNALVGARPARRGGGRSRVCSAAEAGGRCRGRGARRRAGQRRPWAAWPPASWIRWRRWGCRRSAMASAMSTACSPSPSRRAARSSSPTTG